LNLTVVIPTYNRRTLAERAVASVLEDPDLPAGVEVIVSDDGSTDGTLEHLAQRFAGHLKEGKLILLPAPRKADPAATRNFGVAQARGKYIAFLDSDDYWKPGRVKRVLEEIADCDGLCEVDTPPKRSDFVEALFHCGFAPTSSYVWRADLWRARGGFATRYYGPNKRWDRAWEDYEAWLRAATTPFEGRFPRVKVLHPSLVVLEEQPGGAGRVQLREQMRREFWALLRGPKWSRALRSPHYWRHLLGACKAGWL
jgi:glycosyltransferase involved in cell wall biosynthesis